MYTQWDSLGRLREDADRREQQPEETPA